MEADVALVIPRSHNGQDDGKLSNGNFGGGAANELLLLQSHVLDRW